MKTLDFYMKKFFPKYLISHVDLDYNKHVLIDSRTKREFIENNLSNNNIPIINESEHMFLHRHRSIAGIIILYGLFRNAKHIREDIKKFKDIHPNKTLVFYCSKGRLRSPILFFYGKLVLGLNSNLLVLEDGILSVMEVKYIEV